MTLLAWLTTESLDRAQQGRAEGRITACDAADWCANEGVREDGERVQYREPSVCFGYQDDKHDGDAGPYHSPESAQQGA